MKKNLILIVLCTGLIGVMGLAVFLLASSLRQPVPLPLPPMGTVEPQDSSAEESAMVPLYYLSSDHRFLARERRPVVLEGRLEERLATIVEHLLDGPTVRNLLPTIPAGTQLLSLFWDEAQRQVVISLSREFLDRRPGHAIAEWASIYSLVDTVADQDSSIRSVQILVEGELVEDSTLWDLSEPFAPDHTFVLYAPTEAADASE